MTTKRKRLTAVQAARLPRGERGDGDFDPPVEMTRAIRRMRAVAIQPHGIDQPQIARRLIAVNFTPGRRREIDQLTVHVTEGSASSVVSWFNDRRAEASANYMIRKGDATYRFAPIDLFVEEHDKAWHNGRVFEPSAPLVLERPGVNPNEYAIGIECEGDGGHELTDPQRRSLLWLIRDIVRRRPRIALDRRHIVGHHEVYGKKTCPGRIDVSRIVREIAPSPLMPIDEKQRPRVVWSDFFKDWLIVVRVESDTEWYFVRASRAREMQATRAETALSEMPLQPGGE